MTLVDTSAWVAFLRKTERPARWAVRRLLDEDVALQTTDVVVMELLAGARDEHHEWQLRRLLGRCEHLPLEGLASFEAAAALYRRCRRAGETVRALTDCLVAVVALQADVAILHDDRDFAVLARHTELRVEGDAE